MKTKAMSLKIHPRVKIIGYVSLFIVVLYLITIISG